MKDLEGYVASVRECLDLAIKEGFLSDEWNTLTYPSPTERQGRESLLHLGCYQAVAGNQLEELKAWSDLIAKIQSLYVRDQKPEDENGKQQTWRCHVDQYIVASAQLALYIQRFFQLKVLERSQRASVFCTEMTEAAWLAVKHWQTSLPKDDTPNLQALAQQLAHELSWAQGPLHLANRVLTLLKSQTPNIQVSPVYDLVHAFLQKTQGASSPNDPSQQGPSSQKREPSKKLSFPVLFVASTSRSGKKKGGIAELTVELLNGQGQELYRNPLTSAFLYCDENCLASIRDAESYIKNKLRVWDQQQNIRWSFEYHLSVPSLTGRSMAATFAAALWHLVTNTPGDKNVAVSADIDSDGKLEGVTDEDLLPKLEAVREHGGRQIRQVVVARNQLIPGGGTFDDLVTRADCVADPIRHGHYR